MSGGTKSPREAALESLPREWRERLIERARDAGIRDSDDVGWLIVGAVVDGWAAAAEAGRAAQSVRTGIDRLEQLTARIPEQATQAVLSAGRSAGDEVEEKLRAGIRAQADAMSEAIRRADRHSDQQRLESWKNMLTEFDRKAAKIGENHRKKIESNLAETVHQLAQAHHERSIRLTLLSAAVAVGGGVAITLAAGLYAWTTMGQHPDFHHCRENKSGVIWCRVASGSGS